MMKKLIILSLFVLASCAEKKEQEVPKEELIMYEYSEMALLMEQMYEENMALKERIENGEEIGVFNTDYVKMHTAEMTDPRDRNDEFEAYSKVFLEAQQRIYAEGESSQVEAFNGMVNSCVACHKLSCTGPIPRIEKLRISN